MSHHSQEDQDRMAEKMKNLYPALGQTGDFPEGKLSEHDEGGIVFAIGVKDGKIVLHFGMSVAWVGMTPEEARSLATLLEYRADQCEKGVTVTLPKDI